MTKPFEVGDVFRGDDGENIVITGYQKRGRGYMVIYRYLDRTTVPRYFSSAWKKFLSKNTIINTDEK